jgi:hypothetical protein
VADSHATAGAQPGACSPSYTVASGPGPTSGGVSDSDRRSGRLTVDHRLAARLLRLSSGRRRVTPIAGDRQLTVSRPAGRAVLAAVIRAGARGPVPRDPCSPGRSIFPPPASRPRGCRSTRPGGGAWPHRSVDVTAARWPVGCFSSPLLCPGPRPGRTWPVGCFSSPPLCPGPRPGRTWPAGCLFSLPLCPGPRPGRTRPRRLPHLASTVPGPADGPDPARAVHHTGWRADPGRLPPPSWQSPQPSDAPRPAGAGY